jgi:hypothetical protein
MRISNATFRLGIWRPSDGLVDLAVELVLANDRLGSKLRRMLYLWTWKVSSVPEGVLVIARFTCILQSLCCYF